jgi:hypothetical protein
MECPNCRHNDYHYYAKQLDVLGKYVEGCDVPYDVYHSYHKIRSTLIPKDFTKICNTSLNTDIDIEIYLCPECGVLFSA